MYKNDFSNLNDFYSFRANKCQGGGDFAYDQTQTSAEHEKDFLADQMTTIFTSTGSCPHFKHRKRTRTHVVDGAQALMPSHAETHFPDQQSFFPTVQYSRTNPNISHTWDEIDPHPKQRRATHPNPSDPNFLLNCPTSQYSNCDLINPIPRSSEREGQSSSVSYSNTYACPICTMGDSPPKRRYQRKPTCTSKYLLPRQNKPKPLPKRAHAFLTPTWFNIHMETHHLNLFRRSSLFSSISSLSSVPNAQSTQHQEFTCLLCPCGTLAGQLGCAARFVGKEELLRHLRDVHAAGQAGMGRFEHLCALLGGGGIG